MDLPVKRISQHCIFSKDFSLKFMLECKRGFTNEKHSTNEKRSQAKITKSQ